MAAADTSKEEDVLSDDKEAFREAREHEAENRSLALEDIRFARLGEQWPAEIERQRRDDARPCLTINQLPAYVRGVVNDARQNKPGINVHPVDSQADPKTADIFNGLIRQIEQSSDAEVAYDTALDFAVTGGFGYFKINTRYATDDTFDQDIVIERVADPFSIYGDPNSTEADSSDWMSAFELQNVTKKAFEARWKGAEPVSFDDLGTDRPRDRTLEAADHLTLAARWLREDSTKQIVALSMPDPMADQALVQQAMALGISDRLIIDLDIFEENAELFQALGMNVIGQPRDVACWTVTQRILSGADVLEEIAWAGKYIPIVPVYGEEINVEGVRHFRGLVRDAKDLQRNFNYWRTASTEMVALQAKAPWVGEEGAFDVEPDKWATANTQNWPFLQYARGKQPPQRQPFAGVPAGALQEAANATDDMRRIMGALNNEVSGDNESSGRAILARQRQGDIANFHFIDNLSRAIRHGGRIVLDLIPKVYSTQRVIRILGTDGQQQAAMIGPRQAPTPQEQPEPNSPANMPLGANAPAAPQQTAAPMGFPGLNPQLQGQLIDTVRIFDLTVGKYDLTVQAGPSYSSLREELNTVLVELVRSAPQLAAPLAPFIVKTLDMPDAEQIVAAIQQAMQGQGNPQAAKQTQQMQEALQQNGQQLQQAKQQIAELQQKLQMASFQMDMTRREADLKVREAGLQNSDMPLRQYEAQTDRLQAMTDANRVQLEAQPGPLHSPAA